MVAAGEEAGRGEEEVGGDSWGIGRGEGLPEGLFSVGGNAGGVAARGWMRRLDLYRT